MPTAPSSLAPIASAVDARLARLLEDERSRWGAFDPDLWGPLEEISQLVLAGGKRLRPAFCHWGFVAAGGADLDPRVVDAGAAFELLHAFALFHDDVMDGSVNRRGEPTTHVRHTEAHAENGWAGESRRFGEGVAILVGDLAFVYADALMRGASLDALDMWNELRVELNFGQYLDMLGSAAGERRREKALRICRYKSGKYTIERPLHLGALLADSASSKGLLPHLSAYGLPLGDAFQMRDDVLGAFGETAITGKPVGDDLREGKPTPLMAMATSKANPHQREVLQMVGMPDLTDSDVARVQEVIRETGALDELEALIASLTDEAVAAIRNAPIDSGTKEELIALAAFVSWREI